MSKTDSNGLGSVMGENSLPAKIAGAEPLKGKRERFARMLSLGLSYCDAAREAGYPVDKSSFSDNARKLGNQKRIKDRVTHLRVQRDETVWEETRRLLIERQWLWHEADIGDFYEVVEEPWFDPKGNPVLDGDGNPVMRAREKLKPISTLPRELRMCIESLTWTDSGKPNLKLYRKDDANRELRKINGIDLAPAQDEGDEHSRLPDKEFFAELAKQAAELGVNLKMTFEAMVE